MFRKYEGFQKSKNKSQNFFSTLLTQVLKVLYKVLYYSCQEERGPGNPKSLTTQMQAQKERGHYYEKLDSI